MAINATEAREQILDELAEAIDHAGLATACLSAAYEQLDTATADRLEAELFRPVQKSYGRAKRTHAQFAERYGLTARGFELPAPGLASQGVKSFVARAVEAASDADAKIAELQDSMLPIESGDPELRAGLGEARELLEPVAPSAKRFLSVLGR